LAGAPIWLWRCIVAVLLLGTWQLFGELVDTTWISEPSLIIRRLVELAAGSLAKDIGVTLSEIGLGLALGLPAGVLAGLILGRSRFAAALLRPVIVGVNAIPALALAPLLIMWFGLGIAPKIVLVAIVVFFVIFFNTFAGVQAVDKDWIAMLEVMGAGRRERFQKVIAPACLTWILSGLRAALPYSLIAAIVGELLFAQAGVGHLITTAATQLDMTGIYAGLFVLMVLGALLSEVAARLERWLLVWRPRGG
jgi:NitT/TauT family transport system permease protein